MYTLQPLIKHGLKHRLRKIQLYASSPGYVQEEVLFDLIDSAEETLWGRSHGYKDIHSVKVFQERVPVCTYEDIEPFITRIRAGEPNLLWPGKISWFAKSSGTTGSKSKFIPVTREMLWRNHYRGGRDTSAIYLDRNPSTQVFRGKMLVLGGSLVKNDANLIEGDISAIMLKNIPIVVDMFRAPSRDIILMKEWEAKLEAIINNTIHEDITCLSGAPAWVLTLLKKVLEKTGKTSLLDVWPNLELFIHGGISFDPYREQYKQLIPSPKMKYMEAYNASEGFFAIQDDLSDSSMLLMLDYQTFYEFMPLEEIGKPFPKTYTIEEVELGKNYALIISNSSGLWRYLIGDTVTFTSKYPYKIKITGRTKYFINAFGEELIADNAEKALSKACTETGALVKEYTVAPVFMSCKSKGSHQWLIEFEKQPDNVEEFAELLDKNLQSINSDYEAKRYKNLTMSRLEITPVKQGVFYEWLKQKGKLGGQNKVPRLQNDRKLVEEILSMI
jgi:hypothetical protein